MTLQALRAMYEGKVEQQVWNLIKAQHWNASHEVIMDKLAPKAIVNGNHCLIIMLFKEFAIIICYT